MKRSMGLGNNDIIDFITDEPNVLGGQRGTTTISNDQDHQDHQDHKDHRFIDACDQSCFIMARKQQEHQRS